MATASSAEPPPHDAATRAHYERPDVVAAYRALDGLDAAEQALVERYLPRRSRVLDLGCGAGRVALALAAAGHAATGVDRSEPMLAAARTDAAARGLAADFVAADVVALPFDAASFDAAVFAQNGLGHLDAAGKRAALAEIRRVLRPGGRVLLSFRTPYALNRLLPGLAVRRLRPGTDGLGPDEAVEAHGYVHRPSARALRRATAGAGLRPLALDSALTLGRRLPLGPLTPYVGGQFFLVAEA